MNLRNLLKNSASSKVLTNSKSYLLSFTKPSLTKFASLGFSSCKICFRKFLRRLRNDYALSARPQRSAATGFTLLCPQSTRSTKVGSLLFGYAPVEFSKENSYVAIEMSPLCPPDLNGLPPRALHTFALICIR